jgi:hypothetical protein
MNGSRAAAGCVLGCLVASIVSACLDTTPLDFQRTARDAGSDAPEDTTCRRCLSGDGAGCQAAYEQCRLDATCWAVIDCSLRRDCMSPPSFSDRFACADPCLQSAGLDTPNHPAINTLLALNICANDTCRDSCIKSAPDESGDPLRSQHRGAR